ncbi:hypothetical protein BLNAU_8056 [Blattamonas nauphoetae]|uniref:Uncharacterized protein n=1 Tax=Blattamonas nauphoetae TaxID=2049346 RepID=A0ABQ9XZR4_9EUKA|nr:hypothetical protein BLNAU_8056 [Blattamonas nauphoetae]
MGSRQVLSFPSKTLHLLSRVLHFINDGYNQLNLQHPSIHAVSEGDDVMCVAQNASDCGDSVASREVGCVDVVSALDQH